MVFYKNVSLPLIMHLQVQHFPEVNKSEEVILYQPPCTWTAGVVFAKIKTSDMQGGTSPLSFLMFV
jgi:hypothetical protein